MSPRFRNRLRVRKAGIGKILFTILIIVTIVISATFTYVLVNMTRSPVTSNGANSSLLSSYADIFPISASNSSTVTNQTAATDCPTGNWSAIYAQYEAPLPGQQNTSALGQQYLNDPQFMSFLSQYLNLNDPAVNATVAGFLSGNETMFVQQQSQGLVC